MTAKTEGSRPVPRRHRPVAVRESDHGPATFPDTALSPATRRKQCPCADRSTSTTTIANRAPNHQARSGPPAMTAFKPVGLAMSPAVEDVDAVEREPTDATRHLLRLMRTGAIDETIARELGVSLRTVHRRITRLQNLLGARSRFQLGVIACERGWV